MAEPGEKIRTGTRYPPEFRAAAVAAVIAQNGNVAYTAKLLGVNRITLHRWWTESDAEAKAAVRQKFADRIEEIGEKVAGVLNAKLHMISPDKLPVALGIIVDKVLLLRGQPNAIQQQSGPPSSVPADFEPARLTPAELRTYLDLQDKGRGVPALRQASDLDNPEFADETDRNAYLAAKAAEAWKVCPGCGAYEIAPEMDLCSACRTNRGGVNDEAQ